MNGTYKFFLALSYVLIMHFWPYLSTYNGNSAIREINCKLSLTSVLAFMTSLELKITPECREKNRFWL